MPKAQQWLLTIKKLLPSFSPISFYPYFSETKKKKPDLRFTHFKSTPMFAGIQHFTHCAKILATTFLLIPAAVMTNNATGAEPTIKDFTLKNVDSKMVALSSFPNARGFIIIFTSNQCPFSKMYEERIKELAETYAPQQVPLLAIRSTDTTAHPEDKWQQMVQHAADNQWSFPYLADNDQAVARNFQAQKTPHAFVVWNEGGKWTVKYSGLIDDNGALPEMAKHQYVADAVDALLAAREVPVQQTKASGCNIGLPKQH
jgi:peroxiredoxin